MASTLTWLDYSERERRKMLDVIGLFGERTTRDELGLGGVRDAFSDLLFPGTGTVQTRAKYFLFVPWICLDLEKRRTKSAAVVTRGRKLESELMAELAVSNDTGGLIGRRAKEKVQRLPSNIYWQGLGAWGIRLHAGSQDEYHRSLDLFYLRRDGRRSSRHEFDGEAVDERDVRNWHAGLPPAPDVFPEGASFALRRHEAAYLREQILTHCHSSLLAYLLRERIGVEGAEFAWDLASRVPAELQSQLEHGRNFSEAMHGAQLLYNLMLAELRGWQQRIDHYQSTLSRWWSRVDERRIDLQNWDRRRFWRIVYAQNPRVSTRARNFIEQWLKLVIDVSGLGDIIDGQPARQMVEHRESQLKGALARLRSQRALERWEGAAGAGQLDLRWFSARRIIADILAGLEEDGDA